MVATVVFGEHLLAFAYHAGVPAHLVRYLLVLKDVAAWSLLGVLASRRNRYRPTILFHLVAYLIVVVFFTFALPRVVSSTTTLGVIRGVLVPVLGLGIVALLTPQERYMVAMRAIRLIGVGAAFALLQELLLPASFVSSTIGVGPYWVDVKQQPLFVDPATGLPGNFYTASGFPRLSGSFGDPLSAGEVLAAGLILAVGAKKFLRYPRLIILLLTASLLLTFTRDGWVLAGLGILGIWLVEGGLRRAYGRSIAAALLTALVVAFVPPVSHYIAKLFSGADGSTLSHQQAFLSFLDYQPSVLGHGWGSAGSFAANANAAALSFESAYGSLLVEVGWAGTAIIVCLIASLSYVVIRKQPRRTVATAMLIGMALSGFVSENLTTFNAGLVPWLVVGLAACGYTAVSKTDATKPAATLTRLS